MAKKKEVCTKVTKDEGSDGDDDIRPRNKVA